MFIITKLFVVAVVRTGPPDARELTALNLQIQFNVLSCVCVHCCQFVDQDNARFELKMLTKNKIQENNAIQ